MKISSLKLMTVETFQRAIQGTYKLCMSSFCLFIATAIISIVLFQKIRYKNGFCLKPYFSLIGHQKKWNVPIGVGALISWKLALFELPENEDLICESVIRPRRAKARPEELLSSWVWTNKLYRNQGTPSKENIKPFRKAEFILCIS